MWNSLCTIWRTLNIVFWILTALILFYYIYSISDGRFRFVFWRPARAVNGNALKHPEQVNPRDENLVDDSGLPKRAP